MVEEQNNQNLGISDPDITKLNNEVSNIMGTGAPGEDPEFKKSDSSIPTLRTYKQDYSDLIKNKNIGKVEIIAAEMKRGYNSNTNENSEFAPKSKLNPILIILVIAAISIAGYLGFLVLGLVKTPSIIKQSARIPSPLIFSEKQEIITLSDGTKNELEGEIRRTLQKPFPRETIIYTPIIKSGDNTDTFVDLKNFIEISGFDLPIDLSQAVENSYMTGIYSKNERYPVLIIKIKLYENAFAGMVAWENSMASDLSNIWPIKKTTSSDIFKDKIVSNHDIRELDDEEGNLVLVYSFLDKSTLAISTNEEALKAIFERFTFR